MILMAKRSSNEKFRSLRTKARDLRNTPTGAEQRLWEELRLRRLAGFRFRRQKVIYPFIVDFYCPDKKLIIEVEGGVHEKQQDYDHAREETFQDLGYKVLRFKNTEIENELDKVLQRILTACKQ